MSIRWLLLYAALAVFVIVALVDTVGWYRRHYNDEFEVALEEERER